MKNINLENLKPKYEDDNIITIFSKQIEKTFNIFSKSINIINPNSNSIGNINNDEFRKGNIKGILMKLKNDIKSKVDQIANEYNLNEIKNEYLDNMESTMKVNLHDTKQFINGFYESNTSISNENMMQMIYDDILLDVLEERVRASAIVNQHNNGIPFWNFTHSGTEVGFKNTPQCNSRTTRFSPRMHIEDKINQSELMAPIKSGHGYASEGFNFGSGSNFRTPNGYVLVCPIRARQFIMECFNVVGESKRNSMVIAEHMISSDEKNSRKYGIKTLGYYFVMICIL